MACHLSARSNSNDVASAAKSISVRAGAVTGSPNVARQNHALEHATIALLSSRYPESRLSGISFAQGFFIFGEIPTQAIRPTAEQALARLRGAEPELVAFGHTSWPHSVAQTRQPAVLCLLS